MNKLTIKGVDKKNQYIQVDSPEIDKENNQKTLAGLLLIAREILIQESIQVGLGIHDDFYNQIFDNDYVGIFLYGEMISVLRVIPSLEGPLFVNKKGQNVKITHNRKYEIKVIGNYYSDKIF